jgi:hypothetical protein
MEKNILYIQVKENHANTEFLKEIEEYSIKNPDDQLYVINNPLGDKKYTYHYQDNVLVILSPKHKIIFVDLNNNRIEFDEYYDDFIEDLSSISDKFNYKKHIGRPREWKVNNTSQVSYDSKITIKDLNTYEDRLVHIYNK